ncbi:hypothetical protein ACFQ7N_29905 [Streptomyces niveus]|uniref:hypothetical protein n=1 Tax=Streptomyces niveus TaxID=193462 RepID=UPI0036975E8C
MLGYWPAVGRRLALPALATGAVCAAAMAAALVLGDGTSWSAAVPQALAAGAVGALALVAVRSTSTVVSAARTARRYGLTLGPDAVALPSVREVRIPAIEGRTAFHLTDSVRHVVEKDPSVSVQVRVTTGPKETTAVVEAHPAATYKRPDAAACWAVDRVVEQRVAQALRAETADGGAAC